MEDAPWASESDGSNVARMHQSLLWNKTFQSMKGKMLSSKGMSWAILYCVGIHLVADWMQKV